VDDRAELIDVWNRAKKRFDDPSIRPQQKAWISLTKPVGLMEDTALLAAPNEFAREYLENRLRKPGGTMQCGVPVDLGRIDVPAFIYASREDHIVPWKTAFASTQLLGGDSRFVLGASGHIAGVINPPAKRKRHHWTGALQPEASAWLGAAEQVEGSWWPAWSEWLRAHAGELGAAPRHAGNVNFPVIEPAPGRYVKTPAA